MRLSTALRKTVATACAVTLGAAPLVVHTAATARTTEAAMSSISIKVAKTSIKVRGAQGLHAGRVQVEVKGSGAAEIVRFARGYDDGDFQKDLKAADKGDIKSLKRVVAKVEFLGGFQPGGSGTVVLPGAGDYAVFSFSSRALGHFSAGTVKSAPAPKTDGTVIAKQGPTWSGSSTLPAVGTFLFKNKDQTTPHFVILQQVVEGTTTDQVLTSLQSEEQGPPPEFFLQAGLETASISSGNSMTVDYDLPPGQYVVMCFFPDPNMGGMPHALMGMLRMIDLT